jgi:predicted aspartyl protease
MPSAASSSFTVKSNGGVLRELRTACRVSEAFDPATAPQPHPQPRDFECIWDTGASNSVITQRVVDECGLKPIGMTQVHAANSSDLAEVYLVNIILLNRVHVPNVRVAKMGLKGMDLLIGMDIITVGDFAVTNRGGTTVFSFCVPSHRYLDFVVEHNRANPPRGFRGHAQPPKPRRHK